MHTALKPPFTRQSALEKVQRAEDLWNTRDPEGLMHTSINEQAIDESQRTL